MITIRRGCALSRSLADHLGRAGRVGLVGLVSLAGALAQPGAAQAQAAPAAAPAPAPGSAAAPPPPLAAPAPAPDPTMPPTAGDAPVPPTPPPPLLPAKPPAAPAAGSPVVEPPKQTFPAMAGNYLRLSEVFSIRPGFLLQVWAQALQDALPKSADDDGNFAKNIYFRRARLFFAGGITSRLSYFLLWESGNLGLATANADGTVNKNFTAYSFNDVFMDFKLTPNLSAQAGLMLVPFNRNTLQSTATYWTLDIASTSATFLAATATGGLRDTGLQLKANTTDNRFEARVMVSQGIRQADQPGRAPGKNLPRLTGYAQYQFFEAEPGYVFGAEYFGRKKVAGLSAGLDYQKLPDADDPYWALSAAAFASIPLHGANPKDGGDEIGGLVQYLHFDNGTSIPAAALGKQDDLLVEASYYNRAAKLSLFGKYEARFFADDPISPAPGAPLLSVNDSRLYGLGLKYFLAEAYANVTLAFNHTRFPNQPSEARNPVNQLALQLQLYYY